MAGKDTIRVFPRKHFAFVQRSRTDDGKIVVAGKVETKPLEMIDLPAWVKDDPMFGWAVKDGSIEVLRDREAEIRAELDAGKATSKRQTKAEKEAAKAAAAGAGPSGDDAGDPAAE